MAKRRKKKRVSVQPWAVPQECLIVDSPSIEISEPEIADKPTEKPEAPKDDMKILKKLKRNVIVRVERMNDVQVKLYTSRVPEIPGKLRKMFDNSTPWLPGVKSPKSGEKSKICQRDEPSKIFSKHANKMRSPLKMVRNNMEISRKRKIPKSLPDVIINDAEITASMCPTPAVISLAHATISPPPSIIPPASSTISPISAAIEDTPKPRKIPKLSTTTPDIWSSNPGTQKEPKSTALKSPGRNNEISNDTTKSRKTPVRKARKPARYRTAEQNSEPVKVSNPDAILPPGVVPMHPWAQKTEVTITDTDMILAVEQTPDAALIPVTKENEDSGHFTGFTIKWEEPDTDPSSGEEMEKQKPKRKRGRPTKHKKVPRTIAAKNIAPPKTLPTKPPIDPTKVTSNVAPSKTAPVNVAPSNAAQPSSQRPNRGRSIVDQPQSESKLSPPNPPVAPAPAKSVPSIPTVTPKTTWHKSGVTTKMPPKPTSPSGDIEQKSKVQKLKKIRRSLPEVIVNDSEIMSGIKSGNIPKRPVIARRRTIGHVKKKINVKRLNISSIGLQPWESRTDSDTDDEPETSIIIPAPAADVAPVYADDEETLREIFRPIDSDPEEEDGNFVMCDLCPLGKMTKNGFPNEAALSSHKFRAHGVITAQLPHKNGGYFAVKNGTIFVF